MDAIILFNIHIFNKKKEKSIPFPINLFIIVQRIILKGYIRERLELPFRIFLESLNQARDEKQIDRDSSYVILLVESMVVNVAIHV